MTPLFAHATETAPPRLFIIAEIGVNHDGDPDRADQLIRVAAEAGADGVKFQLFHPDRLLSAEARLAAYQEGKASDAHDLLARLTLPLAVLERLRAQARARGLAFIVTPFSLPDIDDARALDLDAVKTASPDAVNTPLLRAAASLGVPLIVSTGTCEADELEPAAALLRGHGPGGCLLHCVSSYPTPDELAALGAIAALRDRFTLAAGYSDHTPATDTGSLAVAAGAVVLEKHLTYDPAAAGPDHAASLGPAAFAEYVRLARRAAAMIGPIRKAALPVEQDVRAVSRQSLCATRDLPAGHRLAPGDLTPKRPGTGVPAAALDRVLGKPLSRALEANHLLTPGHLA